MTYLTDTADRLHDAREAIKEARTEIPSAMVWRCDGVMADLALWEMMLREKAEEAK